MGTPDAKAVHLNAIEGRVKQEAVTVKDIVSLNAFFDEFTSALN
jgi:hypothetical protein